MNHRILSYDTIKIVKQYYIIGSDYHPDIWTMKNIILDLCINMYILGPNGYYRDLEAETLVYKLSWRSLAARLHDRTWGLYLFREKTTFRNVACFSKKTYDPPMFDHLTPPPGNGEEYLYTSFSAARPL